MTNSEAIKILDNLKPGDYSNPYEKGEAIVMAISALQAQETINRRNKSVQNVNIDDSVTRKEVKELSKNSTELDKENGELATDCISKQAAIDVCDIAIDLWHGQLGEGIVIAVKKKIEELPSAQPETAKRIVGKSRDGMTLWYQCDMCNEPVDAQDDFCRGCGRRLTDG